MKAIKSYEWDAEKKESKNIEQKPAKWSKEDDRHLNNVIKRTIAYGDSSIHGLIKDDIDWLKALKDRYTWKPSDEQMEALWNVYRGGKEQAELATLYNDLKKLRKE